MSTFVELRSRKIVKLKLLSSTHEIIIAFLEFPLSEVIFSKRFENNFSLNNIFKT